jgi:hypothetical protein
MNNITHNLLSRLLVYSERYEISIQFWPEQTVVFIAKDDVDLTSFGGDRVYALKMAVSYLDRINKKNT